MGGTAMSDSGGQIGECRRHGGDREGVQADADLSALLEKAIEAYQRTGPVVPDFDENAEPVPASGTRTRIWEDTTGLPVAEFVDAYGNRCSLQQSSHVEPHVWLGVDDGEGCRMHLNRDQVAALILPLCRFVKTCFVADPPKANFQL